MKRFLLVFPLVIVLLFSGCEKQEAVSHNGEVKIPSGPSSLSGDDYTEVLERFQEAGFTNIRTEKIEDLITGWLTKDGEVEEVLIGGNKDYSGGQWVAPDTEVIIKYHTFSSDDGESKEENHEEPVEEIEEAEEEAEVPAEEIEDESNEDSVESIEEDESSEGKSSHEVSYSTNDQETAKLGNTGVFSYKSKGGSYEIYYIIDFDEGYVYFFTNGNGDEMCSKVPIIIGDLNDVLIITYTDGDTSWSEGLHFKYKNQPDHLIMQEESGAEYDFYATSLEDALKIRDSKTIKEY